MGKSSKPREAVVLKILEETLKVEFVGNKRRHEIPPNWVVSTAPLPDPWICYDLLHYELLYVYYCYELLYVYYVFCFVLNPLGSTTWPLGFL